MALRPSPSPPPDGPHPGDAGPDGSSSTDSSRTDDSEAGASSTPDSAAAPVRTRRAYLLVAIAGVVLISDQVTKFLVVRHLTPDEPVTVIPGWLQWRLIRNSGAAFSLGTGSTWVFTVIALVVAAVVLRLAPRVGNRVWAVGLGLLFGGLLGNLTDRLTRSPGVGRGHVVDFIEYLRFPFMQFPVFNLADSAIVCSAILIMILGAFDVPLAPRPPAPGGSGAGTTP